MPLIAGLGGLLGVEAAVRFVALVDFPVLYRCGNSMK